MNTVEVLIETPRLGFVKRRADGAIEFVSPLPCPFNYGSVPGTTSEDGDPVDAVVLGPRQPVGARIRAPVVAVVDFVDGGLQDIKLVVSSRGLSNTDVRRLTLFFWVYAKLKSPWNRWRRKGQTSFRGLRIATPSMSERMATALQGNRQPYPMILENAPAMDVHTSHRDHGISR